MNTLNCPVRIYPAMRRSSSGYHPARALVTGAAGFIGSHLVDSLLSDGWVVYGIDNLSTGRMDNLSAAMASSNFFFHKGDLLNVNSQWLVGVDTVFHLAAAKKSYCLDNPQRDLEVNALATLRLLEAARVAGVESFIHVSTGSVYGDAKEEITEETLLNPVSHYGVSKIAGERYVFAYGSMYPMDVKILRYFHVYGPRQDWSSKGGVISIFANALLTQQTPVIYGDGHQVRSFTYVKDVVDATRFLASYGFSGEAYNVASGGRFTVEEVLKWLALITGCVGVIPDYQPEKPGDIRDFFVSNKKLWLLGFRFQTDLDAGLAETVRWHRSRLAT